MTLTVLAENTANSENPRLKPKHGLSVHVSINDINVLYDFGPPGVLLHNARELGIKLEDVDIAVLSHGHLDHGGGIQEFIGINTKAVILHGRDAFIGRWSIRNSVPGSIAIPAEIRDNAAERFREVREKSFPYPEFVLLPATPGPYPRPADNGNLLSGNSGERLPDQFDDELTMGLRGEKGLVVLTGCSHRGILNIVNQVKVYCPKCSITGLIGGFHLRDGIEKPETIRKISKQLLADLPDAVLHTGHCTEPGAMQILKESWGDRVQGIPVGKTISF